MIEIREILPCDNLKVKEIIKSVGKEFGAVGEGFGPNDLEVEAMSEFYNPKDRSIFLVGVDEGKIIGCGGIASFHENYPDICELKKVFFLPEGRGKGYGKKLILSAIEEGKKFGFKRCYLDTLSSMTSAITLYESLGFKHLKAPLPGTTHGKCDVWMVLDF